jgi:hypothetical protein
VARPTCLRAEDWWKSLHGSYSIAPTDDAVIVRDCGDGRHLELVRWNWKKPANRPRGPPIINAPDGEAAYGLLGTGVHRGAVRGADARLFEWAGEKGDKTPDFLFGDSLDTWLEPVKLDRSGRDGMLSLLGGSSTDIADTIREHVVDRKVNNFRTVNATDPSIIEPAD